MVSPEVVVGTVAGTVIGASILAALYYRGRYIDILNMCRHGDRAYERQAKDIRRLERKCRTLMKELKHEQELNRRSYTNRTSCSDFGSFESLR